MNKNIQVMLADDHPDILKNISFYLNNTPEIEVVGVAENGEKAVSLFDTVKPDVLILDMNMPGLNGLEVLAKLKSMQYEARVVVLSIYDEPSIVKAAFRQGAHAYVLKNRVTHDLVQAIKLVWNGESFVSDPLRGYL